MIGSKHRIDRRRMGLIGRDLMTRLLGFLCAAALLVAADVTQGAGNPTKCTAAQGQAFIDEGRYERAVQVFTCVIAAQPTEVEGYRGRIEAELLLGRYSDAVRDYTRVNAFVLPVHPDAAAIIYSGYAARLASDPISLAALTGASFARWWFFQYAQAIHLLNGLLQVYPDDGYGTLFRGSSRMLNGGPGPDDPAVADLERAIELAPDSPDVRFIVADAYTYGMPNPERAFARRRWPWTGGSTPRASTRSSPAPTTHSVSSRPLRLTSSDTSSS